MANAVTLPGERLAGLTADLFHKLQSGNLTLDEFALFNQRKNPFEIVTPTPGIFSLSVDYSQSLEQMIASGRHDWITAERFPITGRGAMEFEARYFHFDRGISSENAISEIEAADTTTPWSAAKIEHVLSHGKTFPEEQRKFPIVGLGSVKKATGGHIVPILCVGRSMRHLDTSWFSGSWSPISRFLAIRPVSGA